ncbi:MAG: flagellar hook-length control protein FliK [Pseudobdellovibrionaceae bacterium]
MPAPIIVPPVRVSDASSAPSASAQSREAARAEKSRNSNEIEETIPADKKSDKAKNDQSQASFMAFVNHLIATKPANGDKPLASQISGAGLKQIAVPSDILENLYNADGSVNEDGLNAFAAFISSLSNEEMNPTFGAEGQDILAGQAGQDSLADDVQAQVAAANAAAQANKGVIDEDVIDVFAKPVDLSAFNDDEKAKIAAALRAMTEDAGMDIIETPRVPANTAAAAAEAAAQARAQAASVQGQAMASTQAGSVVPAEVMPAKWFDVSGADKRMHASSDASAKVSGSDIDGADIQIYVRHNANAQGGNNANGNGLATPASQAQAAGASGLGKQGSADFAALLEQYAGEAASSGTLTSDVADDAQAAAAAVRAAHISPSAPAFAAGHVVPASASGAAVAQQVASAMGKAGVKDAAQKISVSLNPSELGKVMVDISMDDAQKVKVVLSAEKASSLHLLQKDSSALQQAMQDAGFDLSNMDLEFSFSGEGFGSNGSHEGRSAGMDRGNRMAANIQDVAMATDEQAAPHGIYYDPGSGAARYHAVV